MTLTTTNIVQVNVSTQNAPVPSGLLQSGAVISQGGSTQPANSLTLIQSLAQLTPLLSASVALASLSYSGGTVSATTSTPHGWGTGDVVKAVIAGCSPAGYNGTVTITVTGASAFTYPKGAVGSETVLGTVTLLDESELLQQATTYFAQNNPVGFYLLELGEGTVAAGVTALSTWIGNNPGVIYAYLTMREWDGVSQFTTFLNTYNSPSAKTRFYVTTTTGNYANYAGMSSVHWLVESPTLPSGEFSEAAPFAWALSQAPSSATLVPPMSYAPMYGVTPWPLSGNGVTLLAIANANGNWIGTGAEGGLPSNKILFQGNMADGNPWNYWYATDWLNINGHLNLANEVINGSATSINPLYYNQAGINRLQKRLVQTVNTSISVGLGNGLVKVTSLPFAQFIANANSGAYVGYIVVNAEPFLAYSAENPSDYAIGRYAGLSVLFTPNRGFLQVIIGLQVTNIIV